jgi:tetratricopeptide (TPR) repeat protein
MVRSLFLFVLPFGLVVASNLRAQTSPADSPVPAASTSNTSASQPPKAAAPKPLDPFRAAQDLFRSGKFAEAESAYNSILQTDAQSALAYVGLSRLYLRQNRIADADKAASKASELAPTSNAVRVAVGELRFRQGRIADAQDVFTPLVKANTGEARAYLGLGLVYWAQSYYLHAKLMFDRAYEHDPDDPDIRRQWLFTLTRKERVAALKTYLSGDTDDDDDEREHLKSSLVVMEDAEDQERKGCRMVSTVSESHQSLAQLMYGAQRIRGYGLKIQMNEAKGTLLLDTGASGILINRKLAARAGVEPIVKTDTHGIGDKGAALGYMGIADSIKIGDVEFQGCLVHVVDRNSVVDDDGLIGADVFSHFLVDINFPDRKFNLTPLPPVPPLSDTEKALVAKYPKIARFRDRTIPPEFKDFTPVYRFHHMLLIPTRINDLPSKLFVIDTGAFSDTISPAAAREATKVHSDSHVHVKGLNGSVKDVFTADELTLSFSHFRQPARDMVAFDTSGISRVTGTEISGTLGFAMPYQMDLKIDYRDGLVDFGYEPNRLH